MPLTPTVGHDPARELQKVQSNNGLVQLPDDCPDPRRELATNLRTACFGVAWCGSVRLGSARLGVVRFGSVPLGLACGLWLVACGLWWSWLWLGYFPGANDHDKTNHKNATIKPQKTTIKPQRL